MGRPSVTVVTGPPCSGKTTWVAERAEPVDLIVDWDALTAALSPTGDRTRRPELVPYVAAARDAVYARLARDARGPAVGHAWVITTATGCPLQHLQTRFRADVHVMDTDPDECLRRLHADPDGRDVAEADRFIRSWHQVSP